MIIGILLALAFSVQAGEVPFYTREIKDLRDVGALNENSRSLADGIRKTDLTNGGTVNGSLCFADGTCQTTATSTFTPSVSTKTLYTGAITPSNASGFVGCQATTMTISVPVASTVTATLQTGGFRTNFNIYGGMSILVDGAFLEGCTISAPCWNYQDTNGSTPSISQLSYSADVYLSAGSHTFCFGAWANTASANRNIFAPIRWEIRQTP